MYLTLSLPRYHLKMTSNSVKFEGLLEAFVFLSCFMWNTERISVKTYTIVLKVDLIYIGPEDFVVVGVCVCVCTFQPRNVTGWGSEGVKEEPTQRSITGMQQKGTFLGVQVGCRGGGGGGWILPSKVTNFIVCWPHQWWIVIVDWRS